MRKVAFIALMTVAALGVFILGGNWFSRLERAAGLRPSAGDSIENLRAENTALRVELEKLLGLKRQVLRFEPNVITAATYSSYPFSSKDTLIIAAGELAGVKPKMAVTANGLLIGRVTQVSKDASIVQTVFDRNFEMPVRLGDGRFDALLKGGASPVVSLIPREAEVKIGAGVYSASAELPLGIPLGELGEIEGSDGEVWEAATLRIPYDIYGLKFVSVIVNHDAVK